MASRLLSLAVWIVVLASTAFWGLNVLARPQPLPPQAMAPGPASPVLGELTRLLGHSAVADEEAEPEATAESERFQLLGVVAPRGASHSAQGVALIAVDGQPAKAWRTGATLVDEVVLLAVDRRSVRLGPAGGPATTELTLPDPDEARSTAGAPGVPVRPAGAVMHGGPQGPGLAAGPQGVRLPPGQLPQVQAVPSAGQDSGEDDEE